MEEAQGREVQEGPQEEEGGVFKEERGRQEEENEEGDEEDEEEEGLDTLIKRISDDVRTGPRSLFGCAIAFLLQLFKNCYKMRTRRKRKSR